MDIRNSRAGYPGMDADELARLQRLTGASMGTGASRPMAPASTMGNSAVPTAPPSQSSAAPNAAMPTTGVSPAAMMGQLGLPTGQTQAQMQPPGMTGMTANGMTGVAGTSMAGMPSAGATGRSTTGPAMNMPAANPAAGMLPMEGMFPMGRMSANAAFQPAPATAQTTGNTTAARSGTAADSADTADADMQNFMEQGYLMGPNCFGRDARTYAERLMEYINDEYRDHLTYLALSRRAPDSQARTILRNIARDEMRHARRWAAAYFLITGKRYFPQRGTVEAAPIASYSQALRERYLAESQDAVKYRRFARETNDRCLRRLANETSDDERQHAQHILDLIQRQYR